jgi:hypothetical protein
VFACEEWQPLLQLCREARVFQANNNNKRKTTTGGGHTPASGNNTPNANGAAAPPPPPLDLYSVELDTINDLIGMRSRPHIVPYRRYIYIGSLSNRSEAMRVGDRSIEFVDPDDFVALLSGVSTV